MFQMDVSKPAGGLPPAKPAAAAAAAGAGAAVGGGVGAAKAAPYKKTKMCQHSDRDRCIHCAAGELGKVVKAPCLHGPGARCMNCTTYVSSGKGIPNACVPVLILFFSTVFILFRFFYCFSI